MLTESDVQATNRRRSSGTLAGSSGALIGSAMASRSIAGCRAVAVPAPTRCRCRRVPAPVDAPPCLTERKNPGWSGPGVLEEMRLLRGKDSNLRPSGYEPDELPLLHPAATYSRDRARAWQTPA